MKITTYNFLALAFMVVTMLMPTMALADGLTNHSSVGSVGMLNGREAIVVELMVNSTLKKLAIATMNVGASSVSDAGNYYNFNDAKNLDLGDGWHVPSRTELYALVALNGGTWDSDKYTWTINGSELTFPAAGYIDSNATDVSMAGTIGNYWSSYDIADILFCFLAFDSSITLKVDNTEDKTRRFPVRPFCELPNEVASEEGVEIEGVKYDLFADSHIAEVCRQNYDYSNCPTSVNIPSTVERNGIVYEVKSIGEAAFYSSYKLTQVTLPNSIETIGLMAFNSCGSISSLTIPKSVKSIGSSAFRWCYELHTIYFWSKEPPILGFDMFEDTKLLTDDGTIYVQNDSYLTAPKWSDYAGNIVPLDDLNTYVATLLNGDAPSSELASIITAGHEAIEACSTVQSAQNTCATAKNNIYAQYLAEKKTEGKEAIDAAKSGYDASILNTLATLYKDFIDTAADVEVVREQSAAGVAAIQAAIAFRNDVYSTPTGAGMRLKVTKKDGKVYEFKTSEVESVDYQRVTE